MKRLCNPLFYILLYTLPAFGQVNDNFSDGDYTQGTLWLADTGLFSVDSGWLCSQSKVPNHQFYITTASSLAINCTWEFTLGLGFNTSSTNYVDAVLMSDSARLTGNFNGYFIRIGGTADEISLYRKQNGTLTRLIDGADKRTNHAQNLLRIKITRDIDGLFNLWADTTGTGLSYASEGTVSDTTILSSAYLGFVIRQSTKAFHRKHKLDDILVQPIVPDTIPPYISKIKVLSPHQLEVTWNEPVMDVSRLLFT